LRTFVAIGIPSTGVGNMRTIMCVLLGLIAVLFALVGTAMPLRLPAQAASNRVYYQQFKVAAAVIDNGGQLRSVEEQLKEGPKLGGPIIQASTDKPIDCDPSFNMTTGDRLILHFWRGEWTECYAYPSGRTTLLMSVRDMYLSGLGVDIALYWLVAAAAAWAAIRLRPRRRVAASSISNGS
jgi:hypothetical protein